MRLLIKLLNILQICRSRPGELFFDSCGKIRCPTKTGTFRELGDFVVEVAELLALRGKCGLQCGKLFFGIGNNLLGPLRSSLGAAERGVQLGLRRNHLFIHSVGSGLHILELRDPDNAKEDQHESSGSGEKESESFHPTCHSLGDFCCDLDLNKPLIFRLRCNRRRHELINACLCLVGGRATGTAPMCNSGLKLTRGQNRRDLLYDFERFLRCGATPVNAGQSS